MARGRIAIRAAPLVCVWARAAAHCEVYATRGRVRTQWIRWRKNDAQWGWLAYCNACCGRTATRVCNGNAIGAHTNTREVFTHRLVVPSIGVRCCAATYREVNGSCSGARATHVRNNSIEGQYGAWLAYHITATRLTTLLVGNYYGVGACQ